MGFNFEITTFLFIVIFLLLILFFLFYRRVQHEKEVDLVTIWEEYKLLEEEQEIA